MPATVPSNPSRSLRRPARPRHSLARFARILRKQLPELTTNHHVKSLGIIGSYVRHEEKRNSDLDLLADFSSPEGSDQKFKLAETLSQLLGVKVEVIEQAGLPHYIGKRVMREVVWLQRDGIPMPVKLPRRKSIHKNGKPNGASMEPKREYLDYLQDMPDEMAIVQSFVAGITLDQLLANLEKERAVRGSLQIIGEAANRIPRAIQKMYPQIPWKDIIGMRHAVAHGYDRVLHKKVWEAVTISIPRDEPLVAEMHQAEKRRRQLDDTNAENQEPTA